MGLSLYNKANDSFGGITNFLVMDNNDLAHLESIQVLDVMSWLLQEGRGNKVFFDWTNEGAKWGTIVIGGNVVQVTGYEKIYCKLPESPERQWVDMARLDGFTKADIGKPLSQLLIEGKVHRVYCIYPNGGIGDSPKGAAYMPFYSPKDWDFTGTSQPEAFYIPKAWLK